MQKTIALAGFLFLVACTGTAQPPEPPVRTDITPRVVQQGVFTDRGCTRVQEARIDNCTCEADITAAYSGDAAINDRLSRTAERWICRGTRSEVPEGVLVNQRHLTYEVTRDDAKWLSVIYTYYEMGAGAAHGMATQEALLYDKVNRRWVLQPELVSPAHREGATKAVLDAVREANAATYDGALWPERMEQVFTEKGCEGCILYPGGTGWKVTFMPYTAGPYAVGLVTVPLGGGFVSVR